MTDNKKMKTLGGYEIVDEKAREDIITVSEKADEALSLAKGATKAFVYDTYSDMITELNALDKTELLVNFHVMIRTVCVPDLWISGVSDKHVEYTYTSNEDFIVDLTEDGVVQVGYFVLSALETQKVELEDYVKKDDFAGIDKAGVVKIARNGNYGLYMANNSDTIAISKATDTDIDEKSSIFKPITPKSLDYAVMKALSDSKLEWTEEQKQLARALLGSVGSEDYADSNNKTGVVSINNLFGITTVNNTSYKNTLSTQPANFREIDNKEHLYRPIVPARLDYAVKKALSDCKLTGEDAWTSDEQAAARNRLGVPGYVSGLIDGIKTFVAEYGTTTYEELLNAYEAKKQLVLHIPPNTLDGAPEMYANLTSYNINRFDFVCLYHNNIRYYFYAYRNSSNDTIWEHNESTLAEYAYVSIIDKNLVSINNNEMRDALDISSIKQTLSSHTTNINTNTTNISNNTTNIRANSKAINDVSSSVSSIGEYINGKNSLLTALSEMNTVDILKSVYKFRGGFCVNAGTLHIKNPGIYLIMQGGRGNKTITINYPTGKEFEAKDWSGIILLAYESGVVTPIGIKSSPLFADAFQLPGTFQGWTSDGQYSTTINYPAKCVVSYLGNSNVDYLA